MTSTSSKLRIARLQNSYPEPAKGQMKKAEEILGDRIWYSDSPRAIVDSATDAAEKGGFDKVDALRALRILVKDKNHHHAHVTLYLAAFTDYGVSAFERDSRRNLITAVALLTAELTEEYRVVKNRMQRIRRVIK